MVAHDLQNPNASTRASAAISHHNNAAVTNNANAVTATGAIPTMVVITGKRAREGSDRAALNNDNNAGDTNSNPDGTPSESNGSNGSSGPHQNSSEPSSILCSSNEPSTNPEDRDSSSEDGIRGNRSNEDISDQTSS
jgi:hypothetical protein